ncbi:MAG: EF-P lysine aminoacylase EpmA [Hyphomicrobiaceae bacterium]|nr:EF-P lysine aminoacylase EpmA [Hyphomicrobiaceae bacterium]
MAAIPTPFWHPTIHADRRPALMTRGRIKTALRHWLETQGLVEVETACLQVSPGNEAHLHAFRTEARTEAGERRQLYLHTSPEFAMKKLLAAGEPAIFSFAPVFRNAERGPLHSPEFTMLEWYRAGAPYTHLMDDCATMLRIAAQAAGNASWAFRGRACDPAAPAQRITLAGAFGRWADCDLLAMLDGNGPSLPMMREACVRIGIRVAADDTWSDLFSRVLAERIEPNLGLGRPTILCEYPTHEAALARPAAHDARVAERFELYVCGVELANAFGELTDAGEQRRRFEAEMDEKARVYGERYPIDEDFLAALGIMPAASGAALGFDRLVMLATGATRVDQVLWTPVAEMGTRSL